MPLDGFLANDERLSLLDLAVAWAPAPPLDLNAWAAANLEFGPESPFPGRYDPDRLPFFRRILDVLSPDHPARKVTLLKGAQLGGTLLAQIFAAAALDLDPGGILHVHPTEANATGFARTKWRPMVRQCPRLGEIFEQRQSKEGGNSTLHQERRDGRGWIHFSGANSAASLSMYSVKRLIEDDLSKWEDNEGGDPESQAESRTKAFRSAKILALGTGLLKSNCRTTRSFLAGTQEHLHVPCPHCGHRQPLEPEQFIARINEADPADHPGFACVECGALIEEKHRTAIVAAASECENDGWVAHNPSALDLSFTLWAPYAPFEPWPKIAAAYLAALGDPKSEQGWWNDTAGRAYELPGEAPDWELLKARAEAAKRPRGLVPYGALLLTLSFDCQDEFVDGVLIGWGRELNRFVIDRVRVEGHISTPEARAALNRLVEHAWPTAAGTRRAADLVGIDGNAWTDDVFDWVKRWPRSRVVMLRGVSGDAAPTLAPVRKERRRDGRLVKYLGRFFNIGVNGLKGGLYKFLRVTDPGARGYVDFPAGLEDDYYEQLTAEKRTARIDRKGFTVYEWTKPRHQRNEQLDVMVYGEALAGKLGWRQMNPAQWARLEALHEVAGAHPASGAQAELFMPRIEAAAAPFPRPIAGAPPAPAPPPSQPAARPMRRSIGAMLP